MFHQFDTSVISLVDAWPRQLEGFMHVLSFIGQPAITITILASIGAYGFYRHKRFYTYSSIVALVVFGINSVIKQVVHRERPASYIAPDNLLYSYSFPSGHSAGTVLAYGLLAYIIVRVYPNMYARLATIVLAVLLAVGVGVSRVYLGDHYPTDVLAGWTVGAAGLAMVIWKIRYS